MGTFAPLALGMDAPGGLCITLSGAAIGRARLAVHAGQSLWGGTRGRPSTRARTNLATSLILLLTLMNCCINEGTSRCWRQPGSARWSTKPWKGNTTDRQTATTEPEMFTRTEARRANRQLTKRWQRLHAATSRFMLHWKRADSTPSGVRTSGAN